MKLSKLLAQVITCTIFFGLLTPMAFAQGLHYSAQEIAAWRQRSSTGPYKTAGDAGSNTPEDWTRIQRFADQFVASPMDTGNTSNENLDIWTGYRYQIDSLDQYPIWQGVKMEAAAFKYLLSNDATYGNAVRTTLLAQVRFTHPIHIGYNVASWPVPTSTRIKPTYESGAKEALWLCRLMFAYDYTKDLYNASERAEIETFLRGSAAYFAGRINTELTRHFPNRLRNDYRTKTYAAAPQGVPQWTPPIYAPVEYSRHQVWGDGYVYTHRNADGSLGNRIPRIAYWYNNRVFEKMHFVGLCGVLTGDTMLTWHAKQTTKEFISYSVFADGTYGEYERNGDYGNPNQGSHLYGSINLQSIVMLADALARKGDKSLYRFSTREGVHGTQVASNAKPKSLYTVLEKYAQTAVGLPAIYWGNVAAINRIDINNENFTSTYTINHVTWDYLLAVANKYYRSDYLKDVYTRRATVGAVPYPTTRLTSAGKIWVPWSGTGAEYPGFLFMFGQMEAQSGYTTDCQTPLNLSAGTPTATSVSVSWSAFGAAGNGYRVEYKPTTGSAWTALRTVGPSISLTNLASSTAYEVRVRSLCSASDSSTTSTAITLTTQTVACPVPTGLAVTPSSSTELLVSGNGGSGVVQFRVEYRMLGVLSWSQYTTSTLPFTISGLIPLTTYEIRLTGVCAANSSNPTTLVSATTQSLACDQGTNLRGTPVIGKDSAILAWNAGAGAVQYQIRLRAQGSSNWKFVVVSATNHKEGQLLPSTTYEFQVNTLCASGISGYTASKTFAMPAAPCPLVTGVAVNTIAFTSATVSFVGQGPGYEVRYKPASGSTWTTVLAGSSPVGLTGLLANTLYEVQVRTVCTSSNSAYSASVNFTTLSSTCQAVTNVAATATAPTSVQVTFSNALYAEIAYKLTTGSTWTIAESSSSSPAMLSGLDDGSSYSIRVVALCSGTRSADAFTSVTTPVAPVPCDTLQALTIGSITATTARVTWQTMPGNTRGYNVRIRSAIGGNWTTVSASSTAVNLSLLQPNTRLELQAQNLCAAGTESAWSRSRFFTTLPMPCGTPTAVTAIFAGTDSLIAQWASVTGSTGYQLLVKDLTTNTTRTFTVGAFATTFGVGDLVEGRTYQVTLSSYCTGGQSSSVTSTITLPQPCTASGAVRRETWRGVASWSAGQDVPSGHATQITAISQLKDSIRTAPASLHRLRGFLCIPTSGNYILGIAGGIKAELKMCLVAGDTSTRTRLLALNVRTSLSTFGPTQRSQAIPLLQGGRYYVEVLYYSTDSLAAINLAWQMPGSTTLQTIPASRFSTTAPSASVVTSVEITKGFAWALAPNPAGAQGTRLYGPEGNVTISVYNGAGKLIAKGQRVITNQNPADLADLLPQSPGIYAVSAQSISGTYRARLVRE